MLCGIRNPFDLKQNGVSPTLALQEEDFVLMLVHTPDYVEDVNVAHTDLALAGHTHGDKSVCSADGRRHISLNTATVF